MVLNSKHSFGDRQPDVFLLYGPLSKSIDCSSTPLHNYVSFVVFATPKLFEGVDYFPTYGRGRVYVHVKKKVPICTIPARTVPVRTVQCTPFQLALFSSHCSSSHCSVRTVQHALFNSYCSSSHCSVQTVPARTVQFALFQLALLSSHCSVRTLQLVLF